MKKKYMKILVISIVILLITIFLCNNTTMCFSADDWKPKEMNGGGHIKDVGNVIIGFLQLIGSITSVLVLIILGIKYMMGSAEEKAQYKSTMLPYLIGAIMVFGISNILAIIVDISKVFG